MRCRNGAKEETEGGIFNISPYFFSLLRNFPVKTQHSIVPSDDLAGILWGRQARICVTAHYRMTDNQLRKVTPQVSVPQHSRRRKG